MKKIFVSLVIAVFSLNMWGQSNPAAQQILNKAVAIITNANGVVANFRIFNSGYSGSGEIKSQGYKFNVNLPDVLVWFNGKELYTYNKNTKETTLVNPTTEELAESNPLNYVVDASKNYDVVFSTVKKAGKDVLELTPKKKGEIKRITLTLNKSDSKPEKIVVEPSSGNPITADISSFTTTSAIKAADFEYPKSKYPGVEIIDLR